MRYHIFVAMEIKRKNRRNKVIISTVGVALLIALGAYAYYIFSPKDNKSTTQSTVNLSPATDEEKAAGNQAKSSNADTASNDATKTDTSTTTTTPGTANSPATVSIQTTASAQNGSTYQLRYLINTVVDGATCTLTLTQGSSTVTKTATTQALAQSSTCQGFDIPTSSLAKGSWQATMEVSGKGITGSTTSTIQVQ